MKHETGHFPGHKGFSLYWQSWVPEGDPVAGLVLIHGFGEHSSRYPYSVKRLTDAGIAVFAYDQRGHGQSPGRRGHLDSMGDLRGDLSSFRHLVQARWPDLPLFLFGHSMGSVVVLDYVMRNKGGLKGLITSGVGLEPAGVTSPFKVLLAKILSKIWPTALLPMNVKGKQLSRDPVEIDDYDNDPQVLKKASARLGAELLRTIDWIKANPGELQSPLFMQHGGDDPVNLLKGSENFIADVTVADSELKIYPGSLHDIHRDLDKGKVLTDLVDWIKARA